MCQKFSIIACRAVPSNFSFFNLYQSISTINCNTIVDIILQYILPFILSLTINCNTIVVSYVYIDAICDRR